MAKGIGNGFPMAAVVTTPEIAATMGQALHFNTFGIAVLDAIKEDRCQETSQEVGIYFLTKLVGLVDKHEIVGDMRGKGLTPGWDFIFSSCQRFFS